MLKITLRQRISHDFNDLQCRLKGPDGLIPLIFSYILVFQDVILQNTGLLQYGSQSICSIKLFYYTITNKNRQLILFS